MMNYVQKLLRHNNEPYKEFGQETYYCYFTSPMLKSPNFKKFIHVLRWIFGVIFIVGPVALLIDDKNFKDKLADIFFLVVGLLLLPISYRFIKKYIKHLLASVIVLLLVFNPSPTSFKNFSKEIDDSPDTIYKRTSNYFLFSLYLKEYRNNGSVDEDTYIGILGNFYSWN